MTPRPPRQWCTRVASDERGVATVFGAWVIVGLVSLVVAVVFVGSAVVARHRAQSVADLAALAAAQRAMLALDDPCGAARTIAATSSVTIARCRTDGEDVVVLATTDVDLGPFGVRQARAIARAGPAE
ncbi:helicase/secretion neighborhood TadE-like protein [Williamsia maris]|uniref:Helicase/secretion neighborhood TadE-like protein n=1 Tax=Williamsia maris TaxID=72806 RepID=A0ABT1HB19_9NOCA|nr:helicase/secretion neighborhood TadE-like protein [Williamsia maris]